MHDDHGPCAQEARHFDLLDGSVGELDGAAYDLAAREAMRGSYAAFDVATHLDARTDRQIGKYRYGSYEQHGSRYHPLRLAGAETTPDCSKNAFHGDVACGLTISIPPTTTGKTPSLVRMASFDA